MAAAWPMLFGTLVLLLLVIDCGIVAGLLRGGRLGSLRPAGGKALPLLVAALVLQVLLGLSWQQAPGSRWGVGSVLLVVSLLLLLLVVVWANAQLPGIPLLALGLLADLAAVGLNRGMPVPRTPLQAHAHATSVDPSLLGAQFLVADPETRLPMLGAWAGSSVSRPWSVSETSCRTSACSCDSKGS
jgi:hypothetical protein